MVSTRRGLGMVFMAIVVLLTTSVGGQEMGDVVVEANAVTDNVYMLVGRGGNIGLCVGKDGAFLIDDQFAPLTKKIQAAVSQITDQPVRFVINTHWHGDHVGGNENFGKAGAVIVAHDNVRKRMSTEQFMRTFNRTVPPSPKEALPIITFPKEVSFHLNGDEIRVFHVENAHTDGDSIIHFKNANVIHMGDTYFNGSYPFIDASSGGRIDGVIQAADRVLEMADDNTQIIPGHGTLSTVKELRSYREMLATIRARILSSFRKGKSTDDIISERPTQDFDEKWGQGFMKPEVWVRIVCETLEKREIDTKN